MKKFTLSQEDLPFNFFDEVVFSYEDVAMDLIQQKFTELTESECESIFEKYVDDFTQILYELRDSDCINDYWVGDSEVDEATGTWGYSEYEVGNMKQMRSDLDKEVRVLMKEVLEGIDLQRYTYSYKLRRQL